MLVFGSRVGKVPANVVALASAEPIVSRVESSPSLAALSHAVAGATRPFLVPSVLSLPVVARITCLGLPFPASLSPTLSPSAALLLSVSPQICALFLSLAVASLPIFSPFLPMVLQKWVLRGCSIVKRSSCFRRSLEVEVTLRSATLVLVYSNIRRWYPAPICTHVPLLWFSLLVIKFPFSQKKTVGAPCAFVFVGAVR